MGCHYRSVFEGKGYQRPHGIAVIDQTLGNSPPKQGQRRDADSQLVRSVGQSMERVQKCFAAPAEWSLPLPIIGKGRDYFKRIFERCSN